ncbi:DUF397 domain-containing protein [Streptomyces sp. NBC_00237]|uniref:DUF397 domain-containing protein n=1 Tax=Streptomyces sp. NBC_00237 TaxID=2975687 RepID=UPI0022577D23|nr:DUF397 domain-containing protein [Streptomyces sp. NBC_00237]MCX5200550.1 DUF397 domain-containing protein [Streptomyces sp. NBC_00237]
MPQLSWQKSSFSTGGSQECVELAIDPTGRIHLRESDDPTHVTTVTPNGLTGLLRTVKAGAFSSPTS